MALLGEGAIAMWWNVEPAWRAEFEDWHSREHLPERLSIPGFLRGSRWAAADGGEGFFVLYELDRPETLASPAYLARLNAPTPWSAKLMPHHRDMVRSQCRVLATRGAGLSHHATTLRLSPAPGRDLELSAFLHDVAARIATRPGATAAHLLRTESPALPVTAEQAIRGGRDPAADWVFVANGHDAPTLQAIRRTDIADGMLAENGALPDVREGRYVLSCVTTPADLASA